MNEISGLPRLAADKNYDIRNGCVFDSKMFDKYLVRGGGMNYVKDIEGRKPLFT